MPEHRPRANDEGAEAAGARLARLVAARAGRTRDLTIGEQVKGLAGSMRAMDAGLAGATRAWQSVVPPELARSSTIEVLSRGVLRVRVTDSAVRFELDRFLRAGGEARVIGASPAPIRSIRLQG